jgi:hypothetical protein
MVLLVGLCVAVIAPFMILAEYNLLILFGANRAAAAILCILSAILAILAFGADTDGFEKKSSLMKIIERWMKD